VTYITVVTAFSQEDKGYTDITSDHALNFIHEKNPLILDVRTRKEYDQGHIKDAYLIPVQELNQRYKEILEFREKDIFVYCRSGNRSVVSSYILKEKGFKKITNLKHGIKGWLKRGLSINK